MDTESWIQAHESYLFLQDVLGKKGGLLPINELNARIDTCASLLRHAAVVTATNCLSKPNYAKGLTVDDIAHDVLLKLLRYSPRGSKKIVHFKAWIHVICKRVLTDNFRKARNEPEIAKDTEIVDRISPGPMETVEQLERLARIDEIVKSGLISDQELKVYREHVYIGTGWEEISERYAMPKHAIYRIRDKVENALERNSRDGLLNS